jgi:hypothetical protein
MIGVPRSVLIAALGAALLVPVLTPLCRATPHDLQAHRRDEHAARLAHDADRALSALAADLGVALEHGRSGTARVVDGDQDPAVELVAASDALLAARPAAEVAGRALDALRGVLGAVRPHQPALPAVPVSGTLSVVAGQLADAAAAAGPFVDRRLAAEHTVERRGAALAALDADDPDSALDRVAEARSAHAVVAGWEEPPRALPVWLETSQALIDAVEALAEASLAGDAEAVDAAAAAYRAAAESARQADTALAISIAEAGSTVAAIPLGRLAAMTAQVAELRDGVASVLLGLD